MVRRADAPDVVRPPAFRLPPRSERLDALGRREFDVLVIGGGITGAAAARDAASRGLSVALVDKGDWASGTSWRSSKLVHGGLRYLRSGDFRLVFESLAERALLERLAPHLVVPLEFLFAVLPGRWVSRAALSAGLTLYDLLSLGRGARRHRTVPAREALRLEPLLGGSGLTGGALYGDASTDDARLTLENVLDAAAMGAVVVSRAAAEARLRDRIGRFAGASVRDVETGRSIEVLARVTVEAKGPWSGPGPSGGNGLRLRLSKGAHVTVPFPRLPVRHAVAIPVEKGRLFFAIPSGPVTLLGTTDTEYDGPPEGVAPSRADVAYILARAGEAFPVSALRTSDIISAFAGVRPLRYEEGRDSAWTSREEAIGSAPGSVSVIGGKLTTHRRMGERVIDAAVRQRRGEMGTAGAAGRSRTRSRPFPGAPADGMPAFLARWEAEARAAGVPSSLARHLGLRYGSRASAVLALARGDPAWPTPLVPDLPDCEGEVRFAICEEDARSASDVLVRRTHLFWQTKRVLDALPRVQKILGRELGWTADQANESREEFETLVAVSRDASGEL